MEPKKILLEGYFPVSLNKYMRTHFFNRKKHKDQADRYLQEWWVKLSPAERSTWNNLIPIKKLEYAKITYKFPDRRKRDFDNFSGKVIFDSLRQGNILIDDSSEVIGELRLAFKFGCGKEAGTEIELQLKT